MTAALTPTTTSIRPDARLSFVRLLRSEWIKLTSLRSTVWAIAMILLSGIGLSVLLALTMGSAGLPDEPSVGFVHSYITIGLVFGQIIAAVLGVLAMSGEYSTGMIQSTLTAVPKRLPVLAAKALVLFVLVTAAGLVTLVGSWAVTYPLFDAQGIAVGLTEPDLAMSLVGGALYLGLAAVFALGVGAILRSAAGGVATVLGLLLAVPIFLPLASLVFDGLTDISPYLLSSAGESMSRLPQQLPAGVEPTPGAPLEPWLGGLVVLAWTGVSFALAGLTLRRRDA